MPNTHTRLREAKPPCTKQSLVYENICSLCNKGARSNKEVEQDNPNTPSIYVGETSRSIKERGAEHYKAADKKTQENHMYRHQLLEHGGMEPEFVLRAVKYHRTALERQLGEAVRIRRRGGHTGLWTLGR